MRTRWLSEHEADRLSAALSRVTAMPGQKWDADSEAVTQYGPDLPDAYDNGVQVNEMRLGLAWRARRDPLRGAIAMQVGTLLHEVAEWTRVDGEQIFDPHPDDYAAETAMWLLLEDLSWEVAGKMLREHPKRSFALEAAS